jgi:hypothetical protein
MRSDSDTQHTTGMVCCRLHGLDRRRAALTVKVRHELARVARLLRRFPPVVNCIHDIPHASARPARCELLRHKLQTSIYAQASNVAGRSIASHERYERCCIDQRPQDARQYPRPGVHASRGTLKAPNSPASMPNVGQTKTTVNAIYNAILRRSLWLPLHSPY